VEVEVEIHLLHQDLEVLAEMESFQQTPMELADML
jgi:hypothetical protein